MPATPTGVEQSRAASPALPAMALAALGVVFGDIGTSPLYTFKTVLQLADGRSDPTIVLGVLSLMIWTLLITTTLKYVMLAMSIDNDGEGGILALMSLIGIKRRVRPTIVAIGLFGAALIYGDGTITPAISVLSAVEGLNMALPGVESYVLPIAVVILVLLFMVQPLGSGRIGKAFGPVMFVWFLVLAAMGIAGIARHPAVFAALDPVHAVDYLASDGLRGFLVLGGVFLCVTGSEALYADMGHFGAKPIRVTWLGIVFPSLILNYAGQAAIVLSGAPTDGNIFYRLCPQPLLIPLVILATLATVIASQAIITGAFSMTRQAIQLGWLPRVAIKHTSREGAGQIYVGSVNWILMIATVALTLGFKKSENLASAYGIAVSLTMLMTTVLLFIAMREIWKWRLLSAGLVAAFFFVVDAMFFSANLVKIADGGYVPLALATTVYVVMWVWHRGVGAVAGKLGRHIMSVTEFESLVASRDTPRVPGTAIFLSEENLDVPAVLLWHLDRNRSLHKVLVVLTVSTASVPRVDASKQLVVKKLAPDYWRVETTFGFMERPDVPAALATARTHGWDLDLSDVTYYVRHRSIIPREEGGGLPRWLEALYAAMERNSLHLSQRLHLPQSQTVEIGRQIEI